MGVLKEIDGWGVACHGVGYEEHDLCCADDDDFGGGSWGASDLCGDVHGEGEQDGGGGVADV